MCRFTIISITLLLCAETASAQYQKGSPVQHFDYGPVRNEAPPEAPQAPAQAPGYYAAPPPNGTFQGGAESVGIGGMALHFPAMTLKLPMLELPSLFHLRSQPKVLMEGGQAPYIQYQQPIGVGAPVAVQAVQQTIQQSPRADVPPASPSGPSQKDSYQKDALYQLRQEREIAELRDQLAQVVNSLERITRLAESNQPTRANTVGRTSYEVPMEPRRLPPISGMMPLPRATEPTWSSGVSTRDNHTPALTYESRFTALKRLPEPTTTLRR